MSEPKFAKGPWWLDEYNKWDIRGMSRADEAPPERGLRPCVVCSVNSWLVSADANAELLKAAPEMYALLQKIIDNKIIPDYQAHVAQEIIKLLKKARGEA